MLGTAMGLRYARGGSLSQAKDVTRETSIATTVTETLEQDLEQTDSGLRHMLNSRDLKADASPISSQQPSTWSQATDALAVDPAREQQREQQPLPVSTPARTGEAAADDSSSSVPVAAPTSPMQASLRLSPCLRLPSSGHCCADRHGIQESSGLVHTKFLQLQESGASSVKQAGNI